MKMKAINLGQVGQMKKKLESEMKAFSQSTIEKVTEKAKADCAKIQARVEKALSQIPELDRLQKQLPLEVRRFKKFVKGSRKELDLAITQLRTAVEKLSAKGAKRVGKARKTAATRARKPKEAAAQSNPIDSAT